MLQPLDDGRYELRAFSDDSPDPIVLPLDANDGRALSAAVGEVLAALDEPHAQRTAVTLTVAGREVTLVAANDGVRITVNR